MSKLYIKDLERIKNGKIARFQIEGDEEYNRELSLARLEQEKTELRRIRHIILANFQLDTTKELEKNKIDAPGPREYVTYNSQKLFLKDYLSLTIPTILGNTECLFSDTKLVSSTSDTNDLEKKVEIIFPYIEKLFKIKKSTNILDNEFYEDVNIIDNDKDKVLVSRGDGIYLPFEDYDNLDKEELKNMLFYYYPNQLEILKNILVTDSKALNRYRKNTDKEKALNIYKGIK